MTKAIRTQPNPVAYREPKGAVYYASPTDDLNAKIAALTAGDTLYLRGGNYAQILHVKSLRGQADAYILIAAYPGESVVIYGANNFLAGVGYGASYIELREIVFDGYYLWSFSSISIGEDVSYVRMRSCEVRNTGRCNGGMASDVLATNTNGICAGGHHHEFLGNYIHDNGNGFYDHGLYITGDDYLLQNNDISHNAGYGVHRYPYGKRNRILQNWAYENGQSGFIDAVNGGGAGILLSGGEDDQVVNNITWGNFSSGIAVDGVRALIAQNTCVGDSSGAGYGAIQNRANDSRVVNNIAIGAGTWNVGGYQLFDGSSGSTLETNFTDGDPKFVNPGARDYHLLSSSPCVNAGTDLSAVTIVDLDGGARPQGSAYDIGCYECGATIPDPGPEPVPPDPVPPDPVPVPPGYRVAAVSLNVTLVPVSSAKRRGRRR